MRPQHTPTTIPAQTRPKTISDYTPFEMAEIEAFQSRNRGFMEEDRELSTRFSLDEEFGYYEYGED